MKQATKTEREEALAHFENKRERLYKTGRIIVLIIAGLNVLSAIFLREFNIFVFVIQLALSVALIFGVTWVRYLFVAGAVLNVFFSLHILTVPVSEPPFFFVAIFVLNIAYSLFSAVLLLTSKAVKEFLYLQKNG